MRVPRSVLIMGTALTLLSIATAPAVAEDGSVEPVFQTPKDDPHPDLEQVANGRGWTLDQAASQQRAADAVGAIATKIATAHPEMFIGSALSKAPGGAPTLYLKGQRMNLFAIWSPPATSRSCWLISSRTPSTSSKRAS